MANSSGLTFVPTLHQITPERVAFIYNINKAGSLEVAQYYRDARSVPNSNLIGLSIPVPIPGATGLDCENIVLNKSDYINNIENPLIEELKNIGTDFTSQNARSIWVLILGYGIPIAYSDEGESIAIASRLHRLGITDKQKSINHTYNRRQFSFFGDNDAEVLFLTAVLDGPTVNSVKKLIDRGLDVDAQTFITGKIFIDPYGKKIEASEQTYQSDIIDFIDNELPNLGLDSSITTDVDDPYQEPTILSLNQDAFYWGWFNPTYSRQLFLDQNERRVFLYNADDRSACNIHFFDNSESSPFDVNGSDHWCNLAINVDPGYAACAGAIDDPGADAFLRPRPFFEALHQGATMAEAFLFASKFVNWKTVLIGDPLTVVNFPVDLPPSQDVNFTLIENSEVIRRTKDIIEESLGWAERQTVLLSKILDQVVASSSIQEEVRLLQPSFAWLQSKNSQAQENVFFSVVSSWIQYIRQTTGLSLLDWLISNEEKISSKLNSIVNQTGTTAISSDLIYPEGFWKWEFEYNHPIVQSLDNVFFKLQVATIATFDASKIVLELDSISSANGWEYESEPNVFVRMPDDGFPSNFSGRRVRFSSLASQYLNRSEIYYFKWKAVDIDGLSFANLEDTRKLVIYT